jgi:hypothetical protein
MKPIIGWVLLGVGAAVIFWGIYSSYQIFTGESPAPEIFKAESKKDSFQGKEELTQEEQMGQIIQEQLAEALPLDFIPRLLNLMAWSVFAMILFFGGGKMAEIGIKLLKT